jgi:predicted outer membrane repeat protein
MDRTFILGLGFMALLASGAAGAQPVTLDTDPNLAGWWKFDESAGTTTADSSGHKRDGTLKGGLSFDKNSSRGKAGGAIQLDGKGSWIEIKDYKGVTGTRPRTVSAWIKTAGAQGEIASWGTQDFGQMFIFGHIRGRIGVTPSGGYFYMNPETDDDEWHHVAVVLQDAELPNLHDDVTLYLDGVIAEIHDIGLLDLWPIQTGDDLDVRIGRGFNGLLDDLRIYDRALAENEVKALFELKSNRPSTSSQQ